MSPAPTDPDTFFSVYVPERFTQLSAGHALTVSSPGSIAFRVLGDRGGTWSYRLKNGVLELERRKPEDAIVELAVENQDFEALVVQSAELMQRGLGTSVEPVIALRALAMDAERAKLLRHLTGSLRVSITDKTVHRKLWLLPGALAGDPGSPDCEIQCDMAELLAIQSGQTNPFELLMNGKIRVTGRAEIALALSGLFA